MALSGTLLNVVAVLAGTALGLLVGSRMSSRMQSTLKELHEERDSIRQLLG